MKVAVVAGICVERDAISAAATDQARMLAGERDVDDVVLVAQHHDRHCAARTVTVGDPWTLASHPEIRQADIVIFHWGIRYDLFDALPLIANERQTVVHFHNITPAQLLPAADRCFIEASERQVQLPRLTGTPMWCVSEFNRSTLREWGYPDEQIRVVPIRIDAVGDGREPRPVGQRLQLLTVGRLVPAKGVDVLVDAMSTVVKVLKGNVELVLAGSAALSDRQHIAKLSNTIVQRGLDSYVRIEQDLDDHALKRQYRHADVLVSPSLHEGLCMPVVEAYSAGCNVIGTDAGNLPFVVQPPDPVVPANDPDALAQAIVSLGREVLAGERQLPPGASALVEKHSEASVRTELRAALAELASSSHASALETARSRSSDRCIKEV